MRAASHHDEGFAGTRAIDAAAFSKLRWRCRRGLLENDILIDRLFTRAEPVTQAEANGLYLLMELADNDLLDLLLRRSELPASMDRPEVREVLSQLRRPPPVSTSEGMTP